MENCQFWYKLDINLQISSTENPEKNLIFLADDYFTGNKDSFKKFAEKYCWKVRKNSQHCIS